MRLAGKEETLLFADSACLYDKSHMTTNLTFDLNVAVAFVPIKAHHDKAIGEFMWREVRTEWEREGGESVHLC